MRIDPPAGFRGAFRTDDEARAVYSEAAGIGRISPRAVAVPDDADDAVTLARWAHEAGQPLIARGSGSGMASGAIGDGIIADLSRLRVLGDPDIDGRSIRADAGVLRGQIQRRAASAGLRFAVDPSSGEFCTIGGMASTNASGPHSMRYGSIRPWVLALDCIFADGSRAVVRRGQPLPLEVAPLRRFVQTVQPELMRPFTASHGAVLKDSSGYALSAYAQSHELVDLLVGSEGTLALFVAAELALLPAAVATASIFVSFPDLDHAVEAAVDSRAMGAAACELLDRTFLSIAAGSGQPLPAPADSDAALLVEVESHDAAAAMEQADRLRDRFRKTGANETIVALGPGQEAALWSFRHSASPAIARLDPALRSMQFIEDAAVPPDTLAQYVRGVRSILARHETAGVIFGHAGDAHVHVNPLVDTSRTGWRHRVERILVEVTDLVAELAGTTSGEHGDGRLRTPLMNRIWSAEELDRFALVKRAFDPGNILNPGVKVALHGQRAVDVVKYDPTIGPLPRSAAAALQIVERERAYARHRLDLL